MQELSDFVILTTKPIGLHPCTALSLNFLSGTSVIIGGVIGTALDIGSLAFACLLAIGAGVYVFVATSVGMNVALSADRNTILPVLLGFLVGAIAIGLVLLDHDHCEEGGGHGHDHGGHDGHDH